MSSVKDEPETGEFPAHNDTSFTLLPNPLHQFFHCAAKEADIVEGNLEDRLLCAIASHSDLRH